MAQTATLDPNVKAQVGDAQGPGIYQPLTFSDTQDLQYALRTMIAGADGTLVFLRWNQSAGKANDTTDKMTLNVTAGQKIDIGYVRRLLVTGTSAELQAAGGLVGAS